MQIKEIKQQETNAKSFYMYVSKSYIRWWLFKNKTIAHIYSYFMW